MKTWHWVVLGWVILSLIVVILTWESGYDDDGRKRTTMGGALWVFIAWPLIGGIFQLPRFFPGKEVSKNTQQSPPG